MKSVILSDLKNYVPQNAVSVRPQPFRWRTVEYETSEFSGSMLVAYAGAQAPDIEINPSLSGWYTVRLGLWASTRTPMEEITRVRLTDDEAWVQVAPEGASYKPPSFIEVFWKHADMTDQSVKIGQPNWSDSKTSAVAYIKFDPLSPEQVEEIKADRADASKKRLVGTHDMHYVFCIKKDADDEAYLEEIEPYRHSDIETLHFEYLLGGPDENDELSEMCWEYGDLSEAFPRPGDKMYCHNKQRIRSRGDMLRIYRLMVDHTHKIGRKMYMSYRMNAFAADPPYDSIFNTRFYDKNPQWRCEDADGSEIGRMSYAYTEVQDRVIAYLLHMLETGCDGISLLFGRCFPFVCYEKPARERFMGQHGVDPRTLPTDDPRWLDCKAEIMTEFVRRVREALDDYSAKNKRPRLQLSAHLLLNGQVNRMYGLDGRRWAVEGLVDDIVAHPLTDDLQGHNLTYYPDPGLDVDYYVELVKGTNVKLYCDIMPRMMEPEEFRQRAMDIYKRGAYGVAMWDSYQRHLMTRQWTMSGRLGHKDELPGWNDGEGTHWRRLPIVKMAGHRIDRWAPMWGL